MRGSSYHRQSLVVQKLEHFGGHGQRQEEVHAAWDEASHGRFGAGCFLARAKGNTVSMTHLDGEQRTSSFTAHCSEPTKSFLVSSSPSFGKQTENEQEQRS